MRVGAADEEFVMLDRQGEALALSPQSFKAARPAAESSKNNVSANIFAPSHRKTPVGCGIQPSAIISTVSPAAKRLLQRPRIR